MALADVLANGKFVQAKQPLNPGLTPAALWLKFDLSNATAQPMTRINTVITNIVDAVIANAVKQ